jgi:hypothetical protein
LAAASRLALLFLRQSQTLNPINEMNVTTTMGMAIFAPGGNPDLAAGTATSAYFWENTWSVMRVKPATVGIEAGTYDVGGTE